MNYQREWNRKNKDKRAKYSKEYHNKNKEKIRMRLRTKVTCSCGSTVSKEYYSTHIKRPIHFHNLRMLRLTGIKLTL